MDNKSLSNFNEQKVNAQIQLQNKRNLKDDFCATEKLKNPFKIVNDSIASNKSQVSGNDEMVNLAFNETFTNGCLDLDFSDAEDDDIRMTCDITDFNNQTNNQGFLHQSIDTKSVVSCN